MGQILSTSKCNVYKNIWKESFSFVLWILRCMHFQKKSPVVHNSDYQLIYFVLDLYKCCMHTTNRETLSLCTQLLNIFVFSLGGICFAYYYVVFIIIKHNYFLVEDIRFISGFWYKIVTRVLLVLHFWYLFPKNVLKIQIISNRRERTCSFCWLIFVSVLVCVRKAIVGAMSECFSAFFFFFRKWPTTHSDTSCSC